MMVIVRMILRESNKNKDTNDKNDSTATVMKILLAVIRTVIMTENGPKKLP